MNTQNTNCNMQYNSIIDDIDLLYFTNYELEKNMTHKTIQIDPADIDLLFFKLNTKFQSIRFDLILASIYINICEYETINNIKIYIQAQDRQNDKFILSLQELNIINDIYQKWQKYISKYIQYKYIITQFDDDTDYYCNKYKWQFQLYSAYNNILSPIYKQ